ncbi:hypothetical protein [Dokdonella soli]|uniref:Winged helix-turn-helix domain-containing protein n=1 Tax=Dokdonella soli TaxID=529810 RepID=A0ABP3U3N3_9GAMM
MIAFKPKAEMLEGARRSAAKQSTDARYRIENEYVTVRQIAARLGITKDQVHKRMRELRGASGPITWARLA